MSISYETLSSIADALIVQCAWTPLVAVGVNTHARIEALLLCKPFAHPRHRKSHARMGRALRQKRSAQ